MLVKKDFLNKVRDFGLNTYESKIWTALLSRGVSTAGELSDIANVPRSRSYDVLESLEKKGFIITKPGKPIRHIAVKPSEVIERVKKKVEEQTQEQLQYIEKLRSEDMLNKLNLLHNQGRDMLEPTDMTAAIKGRKNIYNHMATMIRNAKKTITLVTSPEGLIRKEEALHKPLKKAQQKGVKIRIASARAEEVETGLFSDIADVENTSLKARFCITDGKETMFMVMGDDEAHPNYDLAIWVDSEFFADFLESSFRTFLKKGTLPPVGKT
ncbi:hypothetical protein KY358_06065 [Candidatus Woesearchaeota archaeon]|nr:hypothetical protein [Candidatus Woesearchaeota archaeon]